MPKNHPELTAERLRKLFSYDPQTGIFRRLISTSSNAMAGDIAGTDNGDGYLRIEIDGVKSCCHRLAWLYVHGRWPLDQLDHANGVRSDNRIANLREATNADNCQNRSVQINNTSGHSGVSWHSRDRKWSAHIAVNGRYLLLGYFKTIEDAIAARVKAKSELHQFQPEERKA